MVSSRLFYSNFISDISMLSSVVVTGGAVAQSAAEVSRVQTVRQGASSATLTVLGTYTSFLDRNYRVEIHVGGTGAFGSGQWRWTDNALATPIVWNASNLTTQNGVAITLNNGVQIRFDAGPTTPQFVLGDAWDFFVVLKRGPAKALDLSRNTEWRSGNVPSNSTVEWQIDLGSALAPTVFALFDENAQTVTLKGKATGFTDPPTTTDVIPMGANGRRMAIIAPGAFRFWRVTVGMTTAPTLGYLRWSEIFLGTISTFARTFLIGYHDGLRELDGDTVQELSQGPVPQSPEARYLNLHYDALQGSDLAILTNLRAWRQDRSVRTKRPFYFVPIDSNLTDFGLFHWANEFDQSHRFLATYEADVELAEVIRTLD